MILDSRPFRSLSGEEKRERILWAAKSAFLEKGLRDASMDDIAAAAGTTKPTVYAHFNSKEELLAALLEMLKERSRGSLRSPEAYSSEPLEAVARYCGRVLEILATRDVVGYQRAIVAAASHSPELARGVFENIFAESVRCLADYLRRLGAPESDAELILSATTGLAALRLLYGVDEPSDGAVGESFVEGRVNLDHIRHVVQLVASNWNVEL